MHTVHHVCGSRWEKTHKTCNLALGCQKAHCVKTWAETEGGWLVDRCRCVRVSPSSRCSHPALLRVLSWRRWRAEEREQNIWMSLRHSRLVLPFLLHKPVGWISLCKSSVNKWFTALIPSHQLLTRCLLKERCVSLIFTNLCGSTTIYN
jgi:hypothetical protein